MKVASWNVNSLKVRMPHLEEWLALAKPDVVALQEIKMETKAFPAEALCALGYETVASGQKTYNGVAILARGPLEDVRCDIPGFADEQKRVIAATVNGRRIVCAYMPNGQAVGSDKYEYKLRWLAALAGCVREELQRWPNLALLGDYNIAPEDRDVHDPVAWKDQILCSGPERAAFRQFLDLGLADAFRLFEQPEKVYSWWDYRQMGFRLNRGLRIDHILLSKPLAAACRACVIDKAPRKLERPSDHAPVLATLEAEPA